MKKLSFKTWILITIACALFTIIILSSAIASCTKKTHINEDLTSSLDGDSIFTAEKEHQWFYFSNDTFCPVEKPEYAPSSTLVPWPDSIRISSANNAGNTEKAFAIINRLGILCFNNDTVKLTKDISVFSNHTADNLLFYDDIPFFSLYQSLFFSDSPAAAKPTDNNSFLIQFDEKSKIFFPVINTNNITDEKNTEITELVWDGNKFFLCLKTIEKEKTFFYYKAFTPLTPILSLTPYSSKNSYTIEDITLDQFRNSKAIKDFSTAPKRIQSLLSGFSERVPFLIDLKYAGGSSPVSYSNNLKTSKHELNAKAIISKSWSACLFQDGTLFLEGTLPSKGILNDGKTIAVKLPKLPQGFVYSDFVIAGSTLYAAWEETLFYRTNRSGFLCINLDLTLFNKHI